jgi:hypothetical protein
MPLEHPENLAPGSQLIAGGPSAGLRDQAERWSCPHWPRHDNPTDCLYPRPHPDQIRQDAQHAADNEAVRRRDAANAEHEAERIVSAKLARTRYGLRLIDMHDEVVRDEVTRWFADATGYIPVHRNKLIEFCRHTLEADGGFKVVEKVRPTK